MSDLNASTLPSFASMLTAAIASPGDNIDLTTIPKFDKQNFKRWHRDWLKFCISKKIAEAYEAGTDGHYHIRVLQGNNINMIQVPITEADVLNIRHILLAVLPQDVVQLYEEKSDRFPSAKSIITDLKDKYEGESDLAGSRAIWKFHTLKCHNIENVEKHLSDLSRLMDDICESGCTLTDRTMTDLAARTITIPALKATIEAELASKDHSIHSFLQ